MPITTYEFSEEDFEQVLGNVKARGYDAFWNSADSIDILKETVPVAHMWLEPHDAYVDKDGDVQPRIYVQGASRGQDDDKGLHGDTLEEALAILDGAILALLDLSARSEKVDGACIYKIGDFTANGGAVVRWWCANLQNRQMEPDGGGGYRIVADDRYFISPGSGRTVLTGLHLAVPAGYAGMVTWSTGLQPGDVRLQVIEPTDRGEVKVFVTNTHDSPIEIAEGQEVARLHIVPCLALAEEADFPEDVEDDAP